MSKNVVIVESPAKAKTIEKFLGKDFKVLSSQGHVRDIVNTKECKMGIDFNHNYTPIYAVEPKKVKIIQTLNNEVTKAETVWLASDEDREGEAIAWHLSQVLKMDKKEVHRIVFHEITKSAILHAIANPRSIDYNLVDAQQARRVLDRIVGFELSPILWKKIATGLSAGRVQSVAVKIIVEREREIENFEYSSYYNVIAEFTNANKNSFRAELNKHFDTKEEALKFLEKCKNAVFNVESVQSKPLQKSPAPPFTTSTLQQEASRKLKFSVSKTMRIAQSLYEAGHITYMRTDSVNLSELAINAIQNVITKDKNFGEKYYKFRQFKTTSKGAQEAHEAIRPTYFDVEIAGSTKDEQKLYDLIRKRTLACQMANAIWQSTKIQINCGIENFFFQTNGKIVTFDGFTKVYVQSEEEEEEGENKLPNLKVGDTLSYNKITARQSFTKPLPRFTEASLVKKMEELGIGRPSTYATIIATILERNYVTIGKSEGNERKFETISLENNKISTNQNTEKVGSNNGKLVPTDLGKITNDFLVEEFPNIINHNFTAKEEENFDRIAEGKQNWTQVIDNFYKAFHPKIESIPDGKIDTKKLLGKYPKTKEKIYVRLTKLGPCVQLGENEEHSDSEKKPKFFSLPNDMSIYTITLKQAIELIENTKNINRILGQLDGEEIVTGNSRFGAYVRKGNTFVSIPKNLSIQNITIEQAIELLKKKEQQNTPIHDYGDIKVMNGKFGPFIKTPEGNFKIPKDSNISLLTMEECKKIIENSSKNKKSTKKEK